jgi:hypothetical protein
LSQIATTPSADLDTIEDQLRAVLAILHRFEPVIDLLEALQQHPAVSALVAQSRKT